MTTSKPLFRLVSVFVLCLTVLAAQLQRPLLAQQAATAKPAASATDYSAQLAAIEKTLDDKRKELGIPGISLAIVKDDQVIYLKGLGYRDLDKKLPVTPDTRFAIGSASKAFTAMLAVISADEGKLSLDDSPKKFLPYFTLRDTDAAAKITLRDLLAHRSGLNRTDLAMVTGVLNREELIKVAGMAKPTAKLGEKFQYQNVMYAAAGEAVAQAQHSTWDKLIATRIFKPLGMTNSDTTAAAMQKAKDYSFGYDYNPTTKETRHLPQREIPAAAPAGAINSSARDMAQWVRVMLNKGSIDGRRLVSEKGYDELVRKQMNVAGAIDYGLGWFLRQWNGHKVVEHGGNIDGFNSQVAFMPDQKLGFVLLTNVTASPLGAFAMNTIWKNLVSEPKNVAEGPTAPASDPKAEVGRYLLAAAGVNFEVTLKDDKLTLNVPGQPAYPLQNIGGRRYKLAEPAPPGFFATFRPAKDKPTDTELFLEQPQGNIVLVKVSADAAAPATASDSKAPITIDELLAKMIAAYGGEENLLKHKSSLTTIEIDLESQGVQAKGTVSARAPNLSASELTFTALGKKLGTMASYFDGNAGGEMVSFAPPETYTGKRLVDIKAASDFYDVLNWKKNYQTITFKRMGKVGDEDVYIIEKKNEKGTPVTDYVSTKSFLVLRRDSLVANETAGIELPQTEMFSDYRNVDGVMIPFKQVSNNIANGDIVLRIVDLKFNTEIADSVFRKPATVTQQ